jgi:kynurenine formamidase
MTQGDAMPQSLADVLAAVEVVDLTQPLSEDTPVLKLPPPFANTPGLTRHEVSRYDDRGPAWAWYWLEIGEHVGTHFDAPIHWITGKDLPYNAVDTIPPAHFVAPACVLDLSAASATDPDALLSVAAIETWERQHGRIPARAWVLLRTDWSRRRGRDYLHMTEDGPHSPGPAPEAVRWLVEERDVHGFGTETIGTDAGQAAHFVPPFPAHHFMHGAGRYGLQCLANLDLLPPTGAVIIAAPLKIRQGSGSPLRVLALVPAGEAA